VPRLRWWREILIIAVFYAAYSLVRDINGSNQNSLAEATHDAYRIIDIERWLHIFDEARIQGWFIHHVDFMRFWDDYYGTVHFAAVATVLVVLFFRFPANYRLWRNTLAVATALALIGFAWFPLLPPRMLPPSYHFVDSLRVIGGLWDFQSGAVSGVSNQFAAMPSLHTAWSAWCAIALLGVVRPWWGKALLLLYPCATVFCIIVTANHYFADALGGFVALAIGYGVARAADRYSGSWRGWWRSRSLRATAP
jgi:hypothetical protein